MQQTLIGPLTVVMLAMLLAAIGTAQAAEIDLTAKSVMIASNDSGGYAFKEPFVYAGPFDPKTLVSDPAPYAYPWIWEAWFPADTPPTISRVIAQAGTFPATRWRIQLWSNTAAGEWQTVGSYAGDGTFSMEAKFPAQKAYGVRLIIDDAHISSWGNFGLFGFRIYGPEQSLNTLPSTKEMLKLSTPNALNTFHLGHPIEVNALIRNPEKQARTYNVQHEWLDYYLRTVGPTQTTTVQVASEGKRSISTRWTPAEQGAYFCRVTLRYHGAVVVQSLILCGSKDPDILQHIQSFRALKPLGEPSPEALVGDGKLLWSTEMYHQSSHPHFLPGPAHFRALKNAGGNIICAMPTWAAVEPLPGVYNFAYYDHCLRLAEEYGLRVEFGLWNYSFGQEHKWWLMDEYALDQDGKVGSGVNRMFSLAGPNNRAEILKTIELCLKRYKDNPWVGIWQFKIYGHVDWMFPGGYSDFDYSPSYQQEFQRWLRDVKGYSLEQVAKRHNLAYKNWNEVKIGPPVWVGGPNDKDYSAYLELRPLQNDTLEFRDWIMVDRCKEVYDLIRKNDSTRMIGNWLQPGLASGQIELTDAYAIPGGNNGGETIEFIRQSLDMEAPGKWARIEPWGPIVENFGKTRAFNFWLFNCGAVKTKQVNYVFPNFIDNPYWDAWSRPETKQLLLELSDATRPRSRVLGLHSYATNHREGRTTQSYIELDRWYRMLGYSAWMAKPGNWMQWQLSDGKLKDLQDYTLIIDDHGRIMPAENINALAEWVEQGGTLLLFSNSGEAVLGDTQQNWPLLKRLGYPVDPAQLSRLGAHSTLRFAAGNPVFAQPTELAVQAYPVLVVPAGGQLVGTINGQPGAVSWSIGKGKVLLIAGKLGNYDLKAIWSKVGKDDFYASWEPAKAEVEACLSQMMDNVIPWSGASMNQPLRWQDTDGQLLGYYKHNRDTQYVVFLNRNQQDAKSPKFTLSNLPYGDYVLTRIDVNAGAGTITSERSLGQKTALELATGVAIGTLDANRMTAIRITRR